MQLDRQTVTGRFARTNTKVLINVVVAVLLDEFSKAVRNDKEAASFRGVDNVRNRPPPERRCPLERVARELSSYFSLEFLDETIAIHWRQASPAS